jgi:hypothetical protein
MSFHQTNYFLLPQYQLGFLRSFSYLAFCFCISFQHHYQFFHLSRNKHRHYPLICNTSAYLNELPIYSFAIAKASLKILWPLSVASIWSFEYPCSQKCLFRLPTAIFPKISSRNGLDTVICIFQYLNSRIQLGNSSCGH